MFSGFKEFLLRGNVVDLAVAVVIGAAFNTVVDRVVDSLINPVIGMVFSADSLDTAMMVSLPGGGSIAFGAVIGAILNFVIIAAVVYFVFVVPMNKLRKPAPDSDEPEVPTEQELLTEIRDLLRAQATTGAAGAPSAAVADAVQTAAAETPPHRH
ncbi:MAG: large conductance mechanosensitive channel protein MscL [Leucobacter sp.]